MTKIELIEQIAVKRGLEKRQVELFFETFVGIVQTSLIKSEKVSLAGIGVFMAAMRKARTARNPKTGEKVEVPAKRVPRFKAGKELKELVN